MVRSGFRAMTAIGIAWGWLVWPGITSHAAATPASPAAEPTHIRTRGDRFEIVEGGMGRPITFRGVNLGAGAPGHFPGEFAFSKDDYRRLLTFARSLNANAIRLYTLHPPAFYAALREMNEADPDRPLWLFQGVWTELPETNDFWDPVFTGGFHRELGIVLDAVHGAAEVAPRPGHASGRYDADVSPWLAGWLLGREWEPFAVKETERRHPGSTWYHGPSFTVGRGTAMETWLARAMDEIVERERSRYGVAHAVSFVSWPTLDVISHPTESEPGGLEAAHDEDAYVVDPTRIHPNREANLASGFLGYFASYHVYPYYPDFISLDPGYAAWKDRHGACNYAGYLADLKAHTPDLPLLIAEYGIPSSRGISHLQPQGLHHGGASETRQGRQLVRLVEDIEDAGCAGSLLFALCDEWFKTNWLSRAVEGPRHRDPLWHNVLDPEENYGLIAFDPPPRIRVDGDPADWRGIEPYARAARGAPGIGRPLRALYVTSDPARLYLRLDVEPAAGRVRTFGVALDVLDPRRGDTRLPAPLDAAWSRGAEFVLLIDPWPRARGTPRAELFADRAMSWSEFARALDGDTLAAHDAPLAPRANDDGRYAPLIVNVNRTRVGRTGTVHPGAHLDFGRLAYLREAPRRGAADGDAAMDLDAEWRIDRARGVIEIAIPWGLLNVADPSSRAVLDDRPGTADIECSITSGIGLLAWATRAAGGRADSLGPALAGAPPARTRDVQILGPAGTLQSIVGTRINVATPDSVSYSWNGWEQPITGERVKRSADMVRRLFEERSSRDSHYDREYNAFDQAGATRTRPRGPGRRRRPGHRGARPDGSGAAGLPLLPRPR